MRRKRTEEVTGNEGFYLVSKIGKFLIGLTGSWYPEVHGNFHIADAALVWFLLENLKVA